MVQSYALAPRTTQMDREIKAILEMVHRESAAAAVVETGSTCAEGETGSDAKNPLYSSSTLAQDPLYSRSGRRLHAKTRAKTKTIVKRTVCKN